VNVNRLLALGLLAAALALASASRLRAQTQREVAALPPAWVLPPAAQYPAPRLVAVRAGRLFDPRSGTMLTNQVIVIRGDRIVDVGPSAAIPAGARIVDLSRVTVLPGLIDTHLHTMTGSPLTAPGGPGIGPAGADSGVVIESGYSPVGQDNNAYPRCAFAASKGIEVAGATGAMRRGKYGKCGARGNRIPVRL
jgi:hypothetical protein